MQPTKQPCRRTRFLCHQCHQTCILCLIKTSRNFIVQDILHPKDSVQSDLETESDSTFDFDIPFGADSPSTPALNGDLECTLGASPDDSTETQLVSHDSDFAPEVWSETNLPQNRTPNLMSISIHHQRGFVMLFAYSSHSFSCVSMCLTRQMSHLSFRLPSPMCGQSCTRFVVKAR